MACAVSFVERLSAPPSRLNTHGEAACPQELAQEVAHNTQRLPGKLAACRHRLSPLLRTQIFAYPFCLLRENRA